MRLAGSTFDDELVERVLACQRDDAGHRVAVVRHLDGLAGSNPSQDSAGVLPELSDAHGRHVAHGSTHTPASPRSASGLTARAACDPAPAVPQTFAITADDQTATLDVPVGTPGGYVRAELHGQMYVPPGNPQGGWLDMEAMTSPVFLVHGSVPAGTVPMYAPPPVVAPRSPAPAPSSPPSVATTIATPNTGAAVPDVGSAAAVLAAATVAGVAVSARMRDRQSESMTVYEVTLRAHAGESLDGRLLRLVGQVTAPTDGGDHVLTRWVHSCGPAPDAPVDIHLASDDVLEVGAWIEVEATWVRGSVVGGVSPVRMLVRRHRALETPPPRLEGDARH
jgi:hypothetical protein